MGDAVLSIMDRLRGRETLPRSIMIYYGFVSHFTQDVKSAIQPCKVGHQLAMEVGDIKTALFNLSRCEAIAFEIGSIPLPELVKDVERTMQKIRETKHYQLLQVQEPMFRTMQSLLGHAVAEDNWEFCGMSADQFAHMPKERQVAGIGIASNYQMELAYTFGDYREAGRHRDLCLGLGKEYLAGFSCMYRHLLFRGLTSIALAAEGHQKRRNRRLATSVQRSMRKMRKDGNPNVVPMLVLLEAEMAANSNKPSKAERLFKQCVQSSSRGGYRNTRALAHELAGRFFLQQGDNYWAGHHIEHAVRSYREWGVEKKVSQLLREYGDVLMGSKAVSGSIMGFLHESEGKGSKSMEMPGR